MDYPKFMVGEVFPAGEKSTSLVRAVLASRHLLGQIAAAQCLDSQSPAFDEHDLNMFLAAVSAANEAMCAFQEADALGCFDDLPLFWLPQLKEALVRARAASDESDEKSLFSRAIVKCRNDVGAHWSHGRYLACEGAQEPERPGLGFDATGEGIDLADRLSGWQRAGDSRLWKLIVSRGQGLV